MNELSPDLATNVIHTIYALFIHNYILLAYILGLVLALGLALKKPSRFALLFSIGFGVLVFSFEYDKHIVDGLRTQTLNSLITTQPHYKVQRLINLVVGEVTPIILYITGWLFIYLGMVSKTKQKRIA